MTATKSLLWRVSFLFCVGVFFSLMLDFFQIQYRLSAFERNLIGSVFMSSPWWVPAICGTAAVSVGLLYPCLDHKLGEETIPHHWSDVMKCIALFVGINQASAKIELQSDWQPALSLVLLSVSLWWLCDRTQGGFGLSILTALVATLGGPLSCLLQDWKVFGERPGLCKILASLCVLLGRHHSWKHWPAACTGRVV
ncbi:hypothetical protein MRX96_012545 [Rhipicephalus microplus]